MIGKKIKNPNPRSSKAERIKRLTDYIREPENKNSGERKEKCVYSGARGFVCDDPKLQQTEMISLAMAATRSADPINHFVLSWREGEYPTSEQVEETVTIFMNECGLAGHMVVYGLHSDTDNSHLHLAVNRVNPETEKVSRINNGFDIEAAHKAVARIVKAHGWEPEENALFFVDNNGALVDTRIPDRRNREQKPSSRAQDYEQRTGEKSAERLGIETLPDVLKVSSNWEEFHTRMSEHGMRYEKKGSGAIIWVGEQAIKASSADRGTSLSKLEKRFGEFRESKVVENIKNIPAPGPQPLKEIFSANYGWNDYARERREYFAEKKAVRIGMNKRIDTEYKAMLERQKIERDTIYGNSNWKGKGIALNAMRSVVAAQHAGEKEELRERHKQYRKNFSRKFRPFSDFESWMRERGDEKGAELWRHRHESKAMIFAPETWHDMLPLKVDIRAFGHRVDNERGRVDYFHESEREKMGKPSFTDFGKRIEIVDWRDESVTLAALQLSAQKWTQGFFVSGHEEYKELCVRLAVENGLKILNPELQDSLEKGRVQKREAERIESEAEAKRVILERAEAERQQAEVRKLEAARMRERQQKQEQERERQDRERELKATEQKRDDQQREKDKYNVAAEIIREEGAKIREELQVWRKCHAELQDAKNELQKITEQKAGMFEFITGDHGANVGSVRKKVQKCEDALSKLGDFPCKKTPWFADSKSDEQKDEMMIWDEAYRRHPQETQIIDDFVKREKAEQVAPQLAPSPTPPIGEQEQWEEESIDIYEPEVPITSKNMNVGDARAVWKAIQQNIQGSETTHPARDIRHAISRMANFSENKSVPEWQAKEILEAFELSTLPAREARKRESRGR